MAEPTSPAGQANVAYSRGFSDMMQALLSQDIQNTNAYLSQLGSPQQIATGLSGDVLFGTSGIIPSQALDQSAAEFGQFMDLTPSFTQGQLAMNAALNAPVIRSGGGGGGGDDGGLTAYQAASLDARAQENELEQLRWEAEEEREWAKFEAALEQDELERREKEDRAAADSLLYMAILNPELMGDKKFLKRLTRALGMGSAGAAGALTGAVTEGREDEAEAAAGRRERRQDLRSSVGSFFDDVGSRVRSKSVAINQIMADIRQEFPNLAGMKESRVQSMVNNYVNSHWQSHLADRPRDGAGSGGGLPSGVRTGISTAFTDFLQGLDTPTANRNFMQRYRNISGYRQVMSGRAVKSITSAIRDTMTAREWKKNKARVTKMVRSYVNRNKGQIKVKKPPRPRRANPGTGLAG